MRSFIFIILSIVLYYSFFSRGLYFEKDLYGVHIVIYALYIILILRVLLRKEHSKITYFSFLFIIPLLYIVAITYAQFPLGAIHQSLKWLTYVAFFILLFWVSYTTEWIKKYLPYVMQFTGISISLHMYLNVLGILESNSAFIFNRFAGVLQYPNTFGMVLGVFFLYSLILLTKKELRVAEVIIYALPLTIYVYMLIGSLSRGMFVVLPVILIVTLLLRKIQSQLMIIGTGVFASLFTILQFLLPMSSLVKTMSLLIFSGTTVYVAYYLRQLLFEREYVQRFNENRWFALAIPIVSLVSGVLLMLDLLFKGLVYRMLPTAAQELIDQLNDSSTFRERMLFVQDSFELSKQAPFFGIGGEGWTSVYRSVQQLPYRSKRIHNELMEVLVDIGWVGLILFIAVFSILGYFLYINLKNGVHKTVHLAVIISLLQIGLHSLLDFNMQYGATWFLFMWLLAISLATEQAWVNNLVERAYGRNKRFHRIVIYSATIFLLIGIVVSFNFTKAEQSYALAKKTHYIEDLRVAVKKNPYKSDYILEYGKALSQIEGDYTEEIQALADDLAKLEPNNSYVLEKAAHLSQLANNDAQALQYYEEALDVDHFNKFIYERMFGLLLKDKSEKSAERVVSLFNEFEASLQTVTHNPIGSAHNSREFAIMDTIIQQVAQAYYRLNNEAELRSLLEVEIESDTILLEVVTLNIMSLEKNGNYTEVDELKASFEFTEEEIIEMKNKLVE